MPSTFWMIVAAVAALLAATGCVESGSVTCANGRICPFGYSCDDAHNGCASAQQLAECASKAEGAKCSYPGVDDGACFSGVCLPGGCGNGSVDPPEVCDDHNRFHGDG